MSNERIGRMCRSSRRLSLWPVLDLRSTPIANALVDPRSPPTDPQTSVRDHVLSPIHAAYASPTRCPPSHLQQGQPRRSSFSTPSSRTPPRTSPTSSTPSPRRPGQLRRETPQRSVPAAQLRDSGIPTLGIDPSPGPVAAAEAIGVTITTSSPPCTMIVRPTTADVLIANDVWPTSQTSAASSPDGSPAGR